MDNSTRQTRNGHTDPVARARGAQPARTDAAPPVSQLSNLDFRLSAYTVHWVVEGTLNIVVDGDAVTIPAGRYFVSSPRQRVFENRENALQARTITLTIPERVMRAAYFELRHSSQSFFRHRPELDSWPVDFCPVPQPQEAYIHDILTDITGSVDKHADSHVSQSRHFELLAERLLLKENTVVPIPGQRSRRLKAPAGRDWESTVRAFIEKNYARPLTLKQMAEAMFLSPHHFLRRFKSVFGLTPYQYLIAKRLTVACTLLSTTSLRVEEISERVGYPSVNGFYRAFQRRYGRSPSTFRSRR
ncbi:MAG: AraC family transcriptional regulator [Pseudomonadota bacterium]